jgi:zinc protease
MIKGVAMVKKYFYPLIIFALLYSLKTLQAYEYPIYEYTLDNGLKVLIMEKHTMPVVAVQVWYRVGSHNEWPGVRGIAHLFEHMMFRGSENYGPEEHARLINEVGGTNNAYTTEDMTVYHERLPAAELELALKLEAERMHLLKLDQNVLNTEREVVKEEYRLRVETSPIGKIFLKFRQIMYPDHPYNWTPIGIMADLDSISVEDSREFYNSFYAPNNAVLVIVGNVDNQYALNLVEKYFGIIPVKEVYPEPDLSLPPQDQLQKLKEKSSLEIPITAVAFHIPCAEHPDIIPLQVLSYILSWGESSRLHKALVRDKELAVFAGGFPWIMQGPGTFLYAAGYLPNINSKKVERALLEEINRLKEEYVTDEELRKARKQLMAQKVFSRYSAEDLAGSIGYAEVMLGDYNLYLREVEEFAKVTREDIRRVANQYFIDSNTTILHIIPEMRNWLLYIFGIIRSIF